MLSLIRRSANTTSRIPEVREPADCGRVFFVCRPLVYDTFISCKVLKPSISKRLPGLGVISSRSYSNGGKRSKNVNSLSVFHRNPCVYESIM